MNTAPAPGWCANWRPSTVRFVALLGDLQGPKIRIAKFANKRIELQVGDKFRFSTSHARDAGTQEVVGIDYPDLVKDCGVGDELLLDDGTGW